MKISAILLVSIALLGTAATAVRAEEPETAQPEAVAVPYYTGSIVMPESANDAPKLSDNITAIDVDGSVGYVDANQHFVGLSN
jgi:hypothetical protein